MSCQEGACEQILAHSNDGPLEDVVVFLGRLGEPDDHVIRPSE